MSFREGWPDLICAYCGNVMTPQSYFTSNMTKKAWSLRKYCSPRCAALKRANKPYVLPHTLAQSDPQMATQIRDTVDLLVLQAEVRSYEQKEDRYFE